MGQIDQFVLSVRCVGSVRFVLLGQFVLVGLFVLLGQFVLLCWVSSFCWVCSFCWVGFFSFVGSVCIVEQVRFIVLSVFCEKKYSKTSVCDTLCVCCMYAVAWCGLLFECVADYSDYLVLCVMRYCFRIC